MSATFLQQLKKFREKKLFGLLFRHYYQPDRRIPWYPYRQKIKRQTSASPWRNWTEKVHEQACMPATRARVLDEGGSVDAFVDTFYSSGDFDIGAGYLDWMAERDPKTLARIVAADRWTLETYGHGSAIVQASHSHLILPLCNDRDLETQVVWAIKNFEFHFGRSPKAAWLPEAAVSRRALQMLSTHGIERVILGRFQAKRFRKIGGPDEWTEAGFEGQNIDERRPYRIKLDPAPDITVVFYHGGVSAKFSFPPERLIRDAPRLVAAMLDGLASGDGDWPKIRVVASDGETAGHHQELGYMGLAKAAELFCKADSPATLINTGAFVELAPPEYEVEVYESSWSCPHEGFGRWVRECGCASELDPEGHQRWRQPIRNAMDWLRDQAHAWFGSPEGGQRWFPDPWAARNAFIEVILRKGRKTAVDVFAEQYCHAGLGPKQVREAIIALEMMTDLMKQYTSCGWFFGSLGLEMGQNLQFAFRAILQAKRLGLDWEFAFVTRLETAPYRWGTGASLWNQKLRPWAVRCEIQSLIREFAKTHDLDTLKRLRELAEIAGTLLVEWWPPQDWLLKCYRKVHEKLTGDEEPAKTLRTEFYAIAQRLRLQPHVLEDDLRAWQEARKARKPRKSDT